MTVIRNLIRFFKNGTKIFTLTEQKGIITICKNLNKKNGNLFPIFTECQNIYGKEYIYGFLVTVKEYIITTFD